MNARLSAACIGMLCLVSRAGAADSVPVSGHQPGDEAAVLAVVDQFMIAISTNDLTLMASLQLPDGVTYRARPAEGGGVEVISSPNSYWVQPERADGRARIERYWSPTVLVRGHIAAVWTPYEFWLDGERSHCGIDTFNLVKMDGRWRVANAMWTVEPDGCASLDPPAPSEMRPAR
jgi:hypothetical protein